MSVTAQLEPLTIPTYPVGIPEKNPVFFDKRVYQGSNGKVYPVPFIDKVHDDPVPVQYQSARLENEFVRLVMLPEIGGRIFLGQDKTNSDYDFFYRQDVIKPALVGLAGPWISGGVEFNWPQHHRPGTFMPADVFIEEESDGARTIWMSELDPLNRLKGMHGIRLRPGSSLIEVRGRLFNRTPLSQSFLWWSNIAAMVHDQYQSFFPPDVRYVADHAVRAMSSFPNAENPYYGVDYRNRPGANGLDWYKNIPVPTSYMVCQTRFDFFGGYDFKAKGGFIHVANRHIAPGKKQWTWGMEAFGLAWDRELTDANGPYIELMAGVFTDNQPDFSYLSPYETKTFSQFLWPIQGVGPVQQATDRAALHMVVREDRIIELAICVPSFLDEGRLVLTCGGEVLLETIISLSPGQIWEHAGLVFQGENPAELCATLLDSDGTCLLRYRPVDESTLSRDRVLASEPALPAEMLSSDELYLTGEHLELYRHPTRRPEAYWEEALRRDPGDARCNIGMGRRALRAGRLQDAVRFLRAAIVRLTHRHPNPETGEAHYLLGVSLRNDGAHDDAYAAFYKATWNSAWKSAAFFNLAVLDCRRMEFERAAEHLKQCIQTDGDHIKARVLQAIIQRLVGDPSAAKEILMRVLSDDPLDPWANHEAAVCGLKTLDEFFGLFRNDSQTILDVFFEYADCGLADEAAELLMGHHVRPCTKIAVPNPLERSPMTHYALAWVKQDKDLLVKARRSSPDYFFPSRLHEQLVLEWAIQQPGADPVASYGLGNHFYDIQRYEDAIVAWQRAISEGASFATVYRNLGIALWNVRNDGESARCLYLKAMELDPSDARLVSEYDQLCSKLNDPMMDRLQFLESRLGLVLERDDSAISLVTLYNLTGNPSRALEILAKRRFHPWEGGEGCVIRQFTHAHLQLGRVAMAIGDFEGAWEHFNGAMNTPPNLGEAYHPLQAKADVNYWIGRALGGMGRMQEARESYLQCANETGDFSEMMVTAHSPLSYYRGLALRELGREEEARTLFQDLKIFALAKLREIAKIDYFATSLPNLLVFHEDLQRRKDAENQLLLALAEMGLGNVAEANAALDMVLAFNQADPYAVDLGSEIAKRSR